MNLTICDKQQKKQEWKVTSFRFSGGEEHIRLAPVSAKAICSVNLVMRLTNSDAVMRLLLIIDAVKRVVSANTPIELEIPYLPYARQDRVCVPGEAFSLSVMAHLLNGLGVNKIKVWDAHSDVAVRLIHNLEKIDQLQLIRHSKPLIHMILNDNSVLISPDTGATSKTKQLAHQLGKSQNQLLYATKQRSPVTGEILGTNIDGDIKGKDVVIVDDICDGGRTFIELAKVLKNKGAQSITLYVTHGIFSKGFSVFEGYIDNIFTTNSVASTKVIQQALLNASSTVQLHVMSLMGDE